jgi:SAM-dependent methyltransferase
MATRTLLNRCNRKIHTLFQRSLRCYGMTTSLLEGRSGLEIGGPSEVFRENRAYLPIYRHIGSLDNCDLSSKTVWAQHSENFSFHPQKPPGRNIFRDGSDIAEVGDETYEFVLSSHNLEHFANPMKALKEWQRITVKGGILVLVVPNYMHTFDHRRQPTSVSHMLADFEKNTPESDLFHLPEILEKHDLTLDPAAGTLENFRARSLANYENRCLHHHVFDEQNIHEFLTVIGIRVLALETAWPFHIFVIAQMP